ncbi:unnamed protein product [Adineta steineri]|uniref:Uncharacterized protein n=1 Tax=Adineta steineri TaxID=433720 RepID=A0A819E9M4_9BILA|nr:unnamed protein product [Adineta steineri]CAF3846317.1 unnamed protein product [Adineta steineri]
MAKLIVFIAFVCVALAAVHGKPPGGQDSDKHGPQPGGPKGPGGDHGKDKGQWATKICANDSIAQQFLTQTQALITQLQGNSSFAQVLACRQNEINFINDANSASLLSSNCTGFFDNLKAAKELDEEAAEEQKSLAEDAKKAFWAIWKGLFSS